MLFIRNLLGNMNLMQIRSIPGSCLSHTFSKSFTYQRLNCIYLGTIYVYVFYYIPCCMYRFTWLSPVFLSPNSPCSQYILFVTLDTISLAHLFLLKWNEIVSRCGLSQMFMKTSWKAFARECAGVFLIFDYLQLISSKTTAYTIWLCSAIPHGQYYL